jgi:site-specific DNA-cytosine methylase
MENVGALTVRGLDRVLGSLAEIGYDAVWQDIRASDVGAPHRRERIWIVAYPQSRKSGEPSQRERRKNTCGGSQEKYMADSGYSGVYKQRSPENAGGNDRQPGGIFGNGLQGRREKENGIRADSQKQQRSIERQKTFVPGRSGSDLADTNGLRLEYGGKKQDGTGEQNLQEQSERSGTTVANAEFERLEGYRTKSGESSFPELGDNGYEIPDTGNIWSVEWQRKLRSDKQAIRTGKDNGGGTEIDAIWEWWKTEPPVCCLVDGLPSGMDGYEGRISHKHYQRASQLKGLGNAIVPHIAMLIWLIIKEFL